MCISVLVLNVYYEFMNRFFQIPIVQGTVIPINASC